MEDAYVAFRSVRLRLAPESSPDFDEPSSQPQSNPQSTESTSFLLYCFRGVGPGPTVFQKKKNIQARPSHRGRGDPPTPSPIIDMHTHQVGCRLSLNVASMALWDKNTKGTICKKTSGKLDRLDPVAQPEPLTPRPSSKAQRAPALRKRGRKAGRQLPNPTRP